MKKKGRRQAGFCIFIIVLFAAFVFVLGWVNIFVNPGEYGVVISKTSGLYNVPVSSESFCWKWERLLPTNAELRTFSTDVYYSFPTLTGALPSASVYSSHMDSHPDFTYQFDYKLGLTTTPEGLVGLVRYNNIRDQRELELYYENNSRLIAQHVTDYILSMGDGSRSFGNGVLGSDEISELTERYADDFRYIKLDSVELRTCKIPDFEMYQTARKSFYDYQAILDCSLQKRAEEQAAIRVSEDRTFEMVEKLAVLLEKYPALTEMGKSGNLNDIIITLNSNIYDNLQKGD